MGRERRRSSSRPHDTERRRPRASSAREGARERIPSLCFSSLHFSSLLFSSPRALSSSLSLSLPPPSRARARKWRLVRRTCGHPPLPTLPHIHTHTHTHTHTCAHAYTRARAPLAPRPCARQVREAGTLLSSEAQPTTVPDVYARATHLVVSLWEPLEPPLAGNDGVGDDAAAERGGLLDGGGE